MKDDQYWLHRAAELEQKNNRLIRTVAAIVLEAGGSITIKESSFYSIDKNDTLAVSVSPVSQTYTITVERKAQLH